MDAGDTAEDKLIALEAILWAAQVSYLLVSDREVPKHEVVEQMPTAEQCAEYACIGQPPKHAMFHTVSIWCSISLPFVMNLWRLYG